MLERMDKLVFYFTIECAQCHNKLPTSHVAIEERKGELICSLCGRTVKVPNYEPLCAATKTLNEFLGDTLNAKYIKLVHNDQFKVQDSTPAAAH